MELDQLTGMPLYFFAPKNPTRDEVLELDKIALVLSQGEARRRLEQNSVNTGIARIWKMIEIPEEQMVQTWTFLETILRHRSLSHFVTNFPGSSQ
jgi:hypothetical protein